MLSLCFGHPQEVKDKICLRALEKITSRLTCDQKKNPETHDTTLQALDENAGGQWALAASACTLTQALFVQNLFVKTIALLHMLNTTILLLCRC